MLYGIATPGPYKILQITARQSDLDPDRNPLGKPWQADNGMMPELVVAPFKAAGWKWGGRFKNRKDCMHFQATG
jgi:hypothetical protein